MNFSIPEHKILTLFGKLEKLNRRATKLGLPLISYEETGKEEFKSFERVAPDGSSLGEKTVLFKEVEVFGEEPKLPNWEFFCFIDSLKKDHPTSFATPQKP